MDFSNLFRLDGKKLFIPGGSRGLGREMALAIAAAGADVFVHDRDFGVSGQAGYQRLAAAQLRGVALQCGPRDAVWRDPSQDGARPPG